jgi:glycine oxidase
LATVDLTVRGAGVFGLAIAWEALRRGARVRVIDPAGPGAGASGGVVGALAPHAPDGWNTKKQFQLDSLLASEDFWAGIESVSGVGSGYGRTGRLQPLADGAALDLARSRSGSAKLYWRGAADWRVIPAGEAGQWPPTSATGFLIYDTLSARLHPRQAIEALACAIQARGGQIVPQADDAGAVVWATGWKGLLQLSEAFSRPIGAGVKGQAMLLRASAPAEAPQLFVDGLHIVPHGDGTIAIGSTSEREFDDPASTDERLDDLLDRAVTALPILHGAPVVARWAGVRPRARTRAPILGAWPGRPGHFVANGGFKIGFGVAPGVATVMADFILGGKDGIPDGFRIENSL